VIDDDDHEDYRRGPGEHYRPPAPPPPPRPGRRRRGELWVDDPDRKAALTIRCRHCTAPPGVICRNLHAGPMGAELPFDEAPEYTVGPAHPVRITDATRGPKQL